MSERPERYFKGSWKWYLDFLERVEEFEKSLSRDPRTYSETRGIIAILGLEGKVTLQNSLEYVKKIVEDIMSHEEMF
jgi:hypothetical protein